MGLRSGSAEYWSIIEQARRLHDEVSSTQVSSDAYDNAVEHAKRFADRLIEDYGVNDKIINDIIEEHLR